MADFIWAQHTWESQRSAHVRFGQEKKEEKEEDGENLMPILSPWTRWQKTPSEALAFLMVIQLAVGQNQVDLLYLESQATWWTKLASPVSGFGAQKRHTRPTLGLPGRTWGLKQRPFSSCGTRPTSGGAWTPWPFVHGVDHLRKPPKRDFQDMSGIFRTL